MFKKLNDEMNWNEALKAYMFGFCSRSPDLAADQAMSEGGLTVQFARDGLEDLLLDRYEGRDGTMVWPNWASKAMQARVRRAAGK